MEALQLDLFAFFDSPETKFVENVADMWTEEEVSMLHEWLLVRTLETLAAATRPDVIQELLEWINGPIEAPFAFRTCCAVAGYNWEELLEGVNQIHQYAAAS